MTKTFVLYGELGVKQLPCFGHKHSMSEHKCKMHLFHSFEMWAPLRKQQHLTILNKNWLEKPNTDEETISVFGLFSQYAC